MSTALPPANCRRRQMEFAAGGGCAAFSVAAHAAVAKPLGEKGDGERVEAHPLAGGALGVSAVVPRKARRSPPRERRIWTLTPIPVDSDPNSRNSRVGSGAAPEGNRTPHPAIRMPQSTCIRSTKSREVGSGRRPPCCLPQSRFLPPCKPPSAKPENRRQVTDKKPVSR
jgi:hypothetical protein